MALIKLNRWQGLLIRSLVIPMLRKVVKPLKEKAASTPGEWDDVAIGALETVIELLGDPEILEVS